MSILIIEGENRVFLDLFDIKLLTNIHEEFCIHKSNDCCYLMRLYEERRSMH